MPLFLLFLTLTISGCGSDSSVISNYYTSSSSTSQQQGPAPAAKFTVSELAGKTIYSASPTTPPNDFWIYSATTFNADGTLSQSNFTSLSSTTAPVPISGTYIVDDNGVLTIYLSQNGNQPPRMMQTWKIASSADKYNSFLIKSTSSTLTEQWFFDQANGKVQAQACAQGKSIPDPAVITTAPAITSASSTIFTAGTAGSYTVTATGTPRPTFTQTGTLPAGITFNATTGVLSGTPGGGTSGSYPLTITASNGLSPDAKMDFILTVNDPATGSMESFLVGNWVFDPVNTRWKQGQSTSGYTGTLSVKSDKTFSMTLYYLGVVEENIAGKWSLSGNTWTSEVTSDTNQQKIGQTLVATMALTNGNNTVTVTHDGEYDTYNRSNTNK